LIRWATVLAWSAVIFALSAIPGSRVPGRFGTLAHFIEYAVLASLLYAALRLDVSAKWALILSVLLSSGYAVTDEIHQSFVPLRVPDRLDWAVDTVGAMFGAGISFVAARMASAKRGPLG
jgi:VanZ family protein